MKWGLFCTFILLFLLSPLKMVDRKIASQDESDVDFVENFLEQSLKRFCPYESCFQLKKIDRSNTTVEFHIDYQLKYESELFGPGDVRLTNLKTLLHELSISSRKEGEVIYYIISTKEQ